MSRGTATTSRISVRVRVNKYVDKSATLESSFAFVRVLLAPLPVPCFFHVIVCRFSIRRC